MQKLLETRSKEIGGTENPQLFWFDSSAYFNGYWPGCLQFALYHTQMEKESIISVKCPSLDILERETT